MIELRNSFIRRGNPENENPDKVINILEKIIDFNEQQKGRGLKILTPKQMFNYQANIWKLFQNIWKFLVIL